MQIQDQPHIGVLGADPAAITQFLRRVQALGAEPFILLDKAGNRGTGAVRCHAGRALYDVG